MAKLGDEKVIKHPLKPKVGGKLGGSSKTHERFKSYSNSDNRVTQYAGPDRKNYKKGSFFNYVSNMKGDRWSPENYIKGEGLGVISKNLYVYDYSNGNFSCLGHIVHY